MYLKKEELLREWNSCEIRLAEKGESAPTLTLLGGKLEHTRGQANGLAKVLLSGTHNGVAVEPWIMKAVMFRLQTCITTVKSALDAYSPSEAMAFGLKKLGSAAEAATSQTP